MKFYLKPEEYKNMQYIIVSVTNVGSWICASRAPDLSKVGNFSDRAHADFDSQGWLDKIRLQIGNIAQLCIQIGICCCFVSPLHFFDGSSTAFLENTLPLLFVMPFFQFNQINSIFTVQTAENGLFYFPRLLWVPSLSWI